MSLTRRTAAPAGIGNVAATAMTTAAIAAIQRARMRIRRPAVGSSMPGSLAAMSCPFITVPGGGW
jgi:hypothetical protein